MRRALVALLATPLALVAQQPEVRVEALWTTRPVWYAGAGLTWRAGNYVRISTVGAVAPGIDDRRTSYRGELIGRMTLDPFRRRRTGFSIGGGLGVAHDAYLVAIAELEGPAWRGMSPAIQGGVGRGYRAGLVLRRAIRGRR